VNPAATERKTADERREAILEAALTEFADRGFEGASTDAIARAAGISQPYVFRLFGTKKELFLAAVGRCFDSTYETFRAVSEGKSGEDALDAMGEAYADLIADQRRLRGQMQAYAACGDPDVREAVQRGFRRLVELVESKGVPQEKVTEFFARGMLINVVASMGLFSGEESWAKRLVSFCWPEE
jgi:AcrR family transcriptional regulator